MKTDTGFIMDTLKPENESLFISHIISERYSVVKFGSGQLRDPPETLNTCYRVVPTNLKRQVYISRLDWK